MGMSTPWLESSEAGAFAETVRKLWDVHNSDLQKLEVENQELRQQLRSHELATQSMKTQNLSEQGEVTSRPLQPRSAWAKVLPQKEEDMIFKTHAETELVSSSIWSFSTRLVSHPMFDVLAAGLILVNAAFVALETQIQGLSIGATLQYAGLESGHQAAWSAAEPIFDAFSYVFGVIFSLELLLKILGQRQDFVRHVWNWIDSAIILVWILSITWGNLPVDPTLLRLARLARLLRTSVFSKGDWKAA